MNAAAFLDRDGVLNERPAPGEHITDLEDLVILPGAAAATQALAHAGFSVVLISNQRSVSGVDLDLIERDFLNAGVIFDAAYYCTHSDADLCGCRKPKPGLIVRAARELDLDLSRSVVIGDMASDVEAGRHAGCYTIRIGTSQGKADALATDVFDAALVVIHLDLA